MGRREERFFPWEGSERTDLLRMEPEAGEVFAATVKSSVHLKQWQALDQEKQYAKKPE